MDITYLAESGLSLFTAYALRIIGVILLLVGAWVASGWVRGSVENTLGRTRLDVTLTKFFANMSAWVILLMATLAMLGLVGIQTASFVAVLGAASLAIGLAFQGTLSNFAAGVMLLTFRPFKVGDAVNVSSQTGKINEIDLFFTKMDTFDNRRIIIPNSKVFGSVIETITFHPTRRADVPVGVSYEADLDHTRSVLEEAAATIIEETEGALEEPAPQVIFDGLADSSVNWIVRVWANTRDFVAVKQATARGAKQALDAAELSIPFPQMDVHLDRSHPARSDGDSSQAPDAVSSTETADANNAS
jgi:small conductance mechanosensitive channel